MKTIQYHTKWPQPCECSDRCNQCDKAFQHFSKNVHMVCDRVGMPTAGSIHAHKIVLYSWQSKLPVGLLIKLTSPSYCVSGVSLGLASSINNTSPYVVRPTTLRTALAAMSQATWLLSLYCTFCHQYPAILGHLVSVHDKMSGIYFAAEGTPPRCNTLSRNPAMDTFCPSEPFCPREDTLILTRR